MVLLFIYFFCVNDGSRVVFVNWFSLRVFFIGFIPRISARQYNFKPHLALKPYYRSLVLNAWWNRFKFGYKEENVLHFSLMNLSSAERYLYLGNDKTLLKNIQINCFRVTWNKAVNLRSCLIKKKTRRSFKVSINMRNGFASLIIVIFNLTWPMMGIMSVFSVRAQYPINIYLSLHWLKLFINTCTTKQYIFECLTEILFIFLYFWNW